MSKVLITGSEGLIGKKLVEYYKSQDYEVYGYDWKINKEDDYYLKLEIDNIFKEKNTKFDIIHHCASQCVIREVIKDPSQAYQNNQITYKVMELARAQPPEQLFLYSSNRVTANIENPYVTSKKYMEQSAQGYKNCYDLDSVIIRPETIWGYKKDDIRVIPAWIENALTGQDLVIYGDEDKELSPLYVDDFVTQIINISNNYDKYKNDVWTITGQTKKARDLALEIRINTASSSKTVYKDAETAQPQRCIKRENEFIIPGNLEEEIKKYMEERK